MHETPPADAARLLITAEMGPWSPSGRYRALQHVPRLRTRFRSVALSLPNDPVGRAPGRGAQLRYFGEHARQYALRAAELRRLARSTDAILVQRGLYVLGPELIVQSLRGFDGRLVFDLDDAVWEPHPELAAKGAVAQWLYGGRQALALMRRADAIVVSTERLAAMLPAGLPEPTILPTVPDVAGHRVVTHAERAPAIVGWVGTPGGLGFLDPLRDAFTRLAADGAARLEVVSSTPWEGPADFHAWRLEEETSVFERFDIGIMPLPDAPYTRAKAGFKLLQYMASGLPVVSSPVGVNVELIERSGAGFLVETAEEWHDALARLAGDAALRSEMGARGRAFVERYGDLDAHALTLTELLTGSVAVGSA